MTNIVTTSEHDGESLFDWQIAVCLGIGMTQEATANAIGCSKNTVNNHLTGNSKFFDFAISKVRTLHAFKTAATVTSSVDRANERAEARIRKLFDSAYLITERLVKKAEAQGDNITIAEAMEIHKNITVWASKFVASEAPKRLDLTSTHTEVHKLDDTTLDRLDSFMAGHAKLFASQGQEIKGEVIDAQLVSE